jgi:predicted transcriptional regulator
VAEKLGITESAVKKHLFDARNKIKGESREMKKYTSYVYRPGRLVLGVSGLLPDEPDTVKVNDNLIRQNLLLLCFRETRTIDELAEITGVPKPYLEPELDWLTSREFLSFTAKKYSTIIPIIGKKHRQDIGELYDSGAGKKLIDAVIENLQKKEADIRKIGFYGSDFTMNRLLWPVIMLFLSYFSRNEDITHRLKCHDEREIRPDGGRYFIIGNDLSDGQDIKTDGYFKPEGWNDFYGIVSDINSVEGKTESYYWLGLYNFTAKKYHPDIINEDNESVRKVWHRLYCSLIESGFNTQSLTGDEKEMLTVAIQSKYVTEDGGKYRPAFIILTSEQLKRLQIEIFKPLLEKITPELKKLYSIISAMHIKNMLKINKGDVNFLTYLDLWYFGIYVYIAVAADGLLYIPDTPEDGAPLTLVLIK